MNENPAIEDASYSYCRAALVFLPSLFFFIFSNIFLLPKVKAIWEAVGLERSRAAWLMEAAEGLHSYGMMIFLPVTIGIVFLEYRWKSWPRLRNFFLTIIVVIFNVFVLLVVTSTSVSALIAAPLVIHGQKALEAESHGR